MINQCHLTIDSQIQYVRLYSCYMQTKLSDFMRDTRVTISVLAAKIIARVSTNPLAEMSVDDPRQMPKSTVTSNLCVGSELDRQISYDVTNI